MTLYSATMFTCDTILYGPATVYKQYDSIKGPTKSTCDATTYVVFYMRYDSLRRSSVGRNIKLWRKKALPLGINAPKLLLNPLIFADLKPAPPRKNAIMSESMTPHVCSHMLIVE